MNFVTSSKVTDILTAIFPSPINTLLQQFYIFTYIRLHSPFILNQNT